MLSNLVGLCELARATGERRDLEPVLIAWGDIVAKRLYLTGSASQGEHFHDDYQLPNQESAHVAETCVTTTWIQLNLQLLRLTGEARFGNQLETTFWNHLAAAQNPRGDDWCYFTPLAGKKVYRSDINCCHSSGPRGMALAPQSAFLKTPASGNGGEFLLVNLLGPSSVTTRFGDQEVTVKQVTDFPRSGEVAFRVQLAGTARFGLRIRVPNWAGTPQLAADADGKYQVREGWLVVPPRSWKNGDRVVLNYSLAGRMVLGEHSNSGRAALEWGPLVLAYDATQNPSLPPPSRLALVTEPDQPACTLKSGNDLTFEAKVRSRNQAEPQTATFVPFADAGRSGGIYRVWLRAPGAAWPANDSVLADGQESRSRQGNQNGSINDGDLGSIVVTFDGQPANEDWYAVTLPEPATIQRIVFAHGSTFHDGGWFDTSNGKPRIQVRRTPNAKWETIGELTDYPSTTSTSAGGIHDGQTFTLRLASPVKAFAVRVIGKPSSGDNPQQAFSSCGELQAYAQ